MDWFLYDNGLRHERVNPHMHEIFLQLYYMKWVPKDPQKEMLI